MQFVERERQKQTKRKRERLRKSREVETFVGTTKRKGERDRGEGRSCPLCLGTGHLHRETFHGKFFTRRGFSRIRRTTFYDGIKENI